MGVMQEYVKAYNQRWGSEGLQHFNEALEDSKCLQTLTVSLLRTLQEKWNELNNEDPDAEGYLSPDREINRRNIENLILSLQNIKKDIDANIESFNSPPTKTFFQSNIEQLTAIYQLLFILPSLRPFIPDKSPNASIPKDQGAASPDRVKIEDEESKDIKVAACFDREPRSLSSLPLSRYVKGETRTPAPLGIRF